MDIYIGKKPVGNYVIVVATNLHKEGSITVKARGRSISKAVDVVELARRSLAKDAKIESIEIGTEELEDKESGKVVHVSTIAIKLVK